MTDNEIVEALEACTTQDGSIPCYDCPCWCDDTQKCVGLSYTEIANLINRQKTEIERLNKKVEELSEVLSDTIRIRYTEVKAEAYKEFAERLKRSTVTAVIGNEIYAVATSKGVDNILKEMVGEEE